MDLLYRKEKYEKILKRLELLQESEDGILERYQSEVNQIIESLKEKSDVADTRYGYLVLLIPLIIIAATHTYKNGLGLGFSVLLALCFYFIIAHIVMNKKIGLSHSFRSDSTAQGHSAFIEKKIDYALSGVEIKKSRLFFLYLFYALFSTCFLVLGYVVFYNNYSFGGALYAWLIAAVMCFSLWIYMYQYRLSELTDIAVALEYIHSEINTL